MSRAIGPDLSHEVLTEVFLRLATDSQKVVRNGALQVCQPETWIKLVAELHNGGSVSRGNLYRLPLPDAT